MKMNSLIVEIKVSESCSVFKVYGSRMFIKIIRTDLYDPRFLFALPNNIPEHIGILPLYEYVFGNQEENFIRYLIFEEKKHCLKDYAFPNTTLLSVKFVKRLIRTIKYIHELGFSHESITPEHIVFDDIDNPFLIGFGNSKPKGEEYKFETSCRDDLNDLGFILTKYSDTVISGTRIKDVDHPVLREYFGLVNDRKVGMSSLYTMLEKIF